MPANSSALTHRPLPDVTSERVYAAGDFMTRHARILESRPDTILDEHIAVANPACLHFYTNLPCARFGNVAIDQFKASTGLTNLRRFHFHCFGLSDSSVLLHRGRT
jgi:hypothetical protein